MSTGATMRKRRKKYRFGHAEVPGGTCSGACCCWPGSTLVGPGRFSARSYGERTASCGTATRWSCIPRRGGRGTDT
jgi:hypothetical protein